MISPPALVFLLGLQRSGSTWLTNIFDAHRDTSVFMEPFAPAHGIFPEFPSSSYFLHESNPALDQLLRQVLPQRLGRYKHLLTPRSVRSPTWFRLDRAVTNAIVRSRAFTPERFWVRARKTQQLNLNRMDPFAPLVQKSDPPVAWIIKELRLAGKIPVLRQAFPEAKYVVLLRHPGANVQAMMSWFERGKLTELRRELDVFVSLLSAQKLGATYERPLELCRKGSLAHVAALYWRVCNETMIHELKDDRRAMVVTYEELAREPVRVAARVLEFSGLPSDVAATDYIERSSTTAFAGDGKLTTLRTSSSYYRLWQEKITPEQTTAVEAITSDSFLMERFQPFYS